MRIKMFFMSILAIAILTNCSNEEDTAPLDSKDGKVAYLSFQIETKKTTRNSIEDPGANESDLSTLYLLTFKSNGIIADIPDGTNRYFIKITSVSATPDAVKISADASKLLVIANPGTKLENAITSINSPTTTFKTFNTTIIDVQKSEIVDGSKGFAMINCGDDTGKAVGTTITDPLVDVSTKIKNLENYSSEAEAKAAAESDPAVIKIERLAAKVSFKIKEAAQGGIKVPDNAKFTFGNWTLDAVNSTYYPFAEKTILNVVHTGSFYKKNFYTKDPNFSDPVARDGIIFSFIKTDYSPKLPDPYSWMNAEEASSKAEYCLENTMAANDQRFENATRIVIRGTYFPDGFTEGEDWFNFAGTNYETFDDLKTAYNKTTPGSSLHTACTKFYDKVTAYLTNKGVDMTDISNFAVLTEAHLTKVDNGGEVVKGKASPPIRWYQGGLNYWYYEIRHDNESTSLMSFGKYGVVRNNWYSLTLGSVDGAGTPWYPDIDNPGPGDPDPTDPIDQSVGMLGIEIEVAPWIIWENEIGI